jgi:hypothetical protein
MLWPASVRLQSWSAAFHQRHADLFLQLADGDADSGLRPEHTIGRARKTLLLDDRQKILELIELHGLASIRARMGVAGPRRRVRISHARRS